MDEHFSVVWNPKFDGGERERATVAAALARGVLRGRRRRRKKEGGEKMKTKERRRKYGEHKGRKPENAA